MSKAKEATVAWLEELKKTGAISEDEWKVLEAAADKPQVAEFIGGSQLRQSDYNRRMNELKSQYDVKAAEILQYEKDLANWRGNTEKSVTQLKQELQLARTEAQRLRDTAKAYGLAEEDLGVPVAPHTAPPGVDDPQNRKGHDPEFDPTQFLKKTEIEELGQTAFLLPAEINDIVAEHVELFGKQPKGMRQIVEQAMRERRTVREVYEETFKVADRRTEIAEQQKEAEIKRRVEEQIAAWRTENPEARIPYPGRPGSSVLDRNSDTLSLPENFQPNSIPSKQESVAAAVARWNSMEHAEE